MSITPMLTSYSNNRPSFKANPTKKPTTFISLATRASVAAKKMDDKYKGFIETLAEKVVAPIINSKRMGKVIDKTANIDNGKMTEHMATVGSIVTTTTYAGTTLMNDKLEKKPARTLALNQIMVTILSTIGAYTINDKVADFTKKMSYKFSDANQLLPKKVLNRRMKGFKDAQKLLTFSLMYRYVAPVLVTPVASKIGKALNDNSPVKQNKK